MRAAHVLAAVGMLAPSNRATPHQWSGGRALDTAHAREVRRNARAAERGSPREQERRIAAAQDKRARKAARRLSEVAS